MEESGNQKGSELCKRVELFWEKSRSPSHRPSAKGKQKNMKAGSVSSVFKENSDSIGVFCVNSEPELKKFPVHF